MLAAISQISDRIFLFIFNNIFTKGIMKMVQKRLMEIIQIGSDKGENDNAVIRSEGSDNTPLPHGSASEGCFRRVIYVRLAQGLIDRFGPAVR